MWIAIYWILTILKTLTIIVGVLFGIYITKNTSNDIVNKVKKYIDNYTRNNKSLKDLIDKKIKVTNDVSKKFNIPDNRITVAIATIILFVILNFLSYHALGFTYQNKAEKEIQKAQDQMENVQKNMQQRGPNTIGE